MKLAIHSIVLAAALLVACSSDHSHDGEDAGSHTSAFASCRAIMDVCHEVDVGEGPVSACHEVAHDSTSEESCAAKKDECIATCKAAAVDAGPASDAGADTGHGDHDH